MSKFVFFMDDFGTRTTCDGASNKASEPHIFNFSLGGVIVASEDIPALVQKVNDFNIKWAIPHLHGHKIRSRKGEFRFLHDHPETSDEFFNDLNALILDTRLAAHGCVICRPGYRDRYVAKFPEGIRWAMSKTAFDISVERAAKYAMHYGRKLDVVFERSGKTEDRAIERYFDQLKSNGLSFDQETSNRYSPLKADALSSNLGKIWSDGKSNRMLQLADLVVHPISQVTTGKQNRAYDELVAKRMLLDFKHPDEHIGVKYSCFDGAYNLWSPPKHKGDPLRIP